MIPHERWQRFMVRWRSRQGPWTLWDLEKRDRLLYSCSLRLFNHGFRANRITMWGFFWTLIWLALYELFKFKNPWLHVLVFIIPIGLSDSFDGSTARNNKDVTPQGTLGDHFRDLFFTLCMGRITLDFGFETAIFFGVVLIEFCILMLKVIAFIWYGGGYTWERFLEFSLDNFQHSSEDRWQAIFLYFGFPTYMVGSYYAFSYMIYAGLILVTLSLGIGFVVIKKEFLWTPTPAGEKE